MVPPGIVTSNFGPVYKRLESAGVSFDPWQQGFSSIALGCSADEKYVATIGGVTASWPRQVGKTYTVGHLQIGKALEYPGLRSVWTSHHGRTTTNTFRSMQGMVRRPSIAKYLAPNGIRTANGEQEIRFKNGSIIMFGAREFGFGRGLDAIDDLVFDEAQILSIRALEDMVPATNQARHPYGALVWFIGTPPRPVDDSEVFESKRSRALSGKLRDGIYVEIGAPADADPTDPAVWPIMNPSFPLRTPPEAIERMLENIPDLASVKREAAGMWLTGRANSQITPGSWKAAGVTEPTTGTKSFGIAFSLDGSRVSVAGAHKHETGVHVELIGAHSGRTDAGTNALADWLAERWRDTALIGISGKAGAKALELALVERRVPRKLIRTLTTPDYFSACSLLASEVKGGTVTHLASDGQRLLDESVAGCDAKSRGPDGSWGWTATSADVDETPLEAVSVALWAARTTKRKPGRTSRVVVM